MEPIGAQPFRVLRDEGIAGVQVDERDSFSNCRSDLASASARLAASDLNPCSGRLPDAIGDGLMLRRTRMKSIGGEPGVAMAMLPTNAGDVDVPETTRRGF